MPDPVGLIGSINPELPPLTPKDNAQGPGFRVALEEQINKVNQLQQDATHAIEDLATGERDDVESVLIATQKADTAFRLLLQVRNKVLDAYDEVKQMRM
jgi:flagellar hook-basal body complex protein FliE